MVVDALSFRFAEPRLVVRFGIVLVVVVVVVVVATGLILTTVVRLLLTSSCSFLKMDTAIGLGIGFSYP